MPDFNSTVACFSNINQASIGIRVLWLFLTILMQDAAIHEMSVGDRQTK